MPVPILLYLAISSVATLLASSQVLAQETTEVAKKSEELPVDVAAFAGPGWRGSADAGFVPGSAMHGAGGEVTMEEVKADLSRRFTISPGLGFSAGLRYSFRDIDAPASALLPATLHSISLSLGGDLRVSDALSWGLRIAPGLNGDLKSVSWDDVKVPVILHARYRVSDQLTVTGGIVYAGRSHSLRVLPMVGVRYKPAEKWTVTAGFPETRVSYRTGRGMDLFAAADFSRGEYHLSDSSLRARFISYRDYRLSAGVDLPLFRKMKVGISGGYAFGRKFLFYEASRDDIRIDSAPFVKAELKFVL